MEQGLTSEEATANRGDDDLETKEATHGVEDIAVLLVDCMNSNDMHEGASGEEDRCADGLEEEEVRALL